MPQYPWILESFENVSKTTSEITTHFLKWQRTYGPTLLPWNNHFHTSEACLNSLEEEGKPS